MVARGADVGADERGAALTAARRARAAAAREAERVRVRGVARLEEAAARGAQVVVALRAVEHQRARAVRAPAPVAPPRAAVLAVHHVRVRQHHLMLVFPKCHLFDVEMREKEEGKNKRTMEHVQREKERKNEGKRERREESATMTDGRWRETP